jgi:hypothetical protein
MPSGTSLVRRKFARVTLAHPREGLTLDDLSSLLQLARKEKMPGDARVRQNIAYGEGSWRGYIEVSYESTED